VRDQIRAARENGVHEYLLWNASNRYTTAALVPPRRKKNKATRRGKSAAAANTHFARKGNNVHG
jgi:hypothetical protein